MFLKKNDVILFQGDSITDSKRDRESYDDLGRGYAYLAASWLLSRLFLNYDDRNKITAKS